MGLSWRKSSMESEYSFTNVEMNFISARGKFKEGPRRPPSHINRTLCLQKRQRLYISLWQQYQQWIACASYRERFSSTAHRVSVICRASPQIKLFNCRSL